MPLSLKTTISVHFVVLWTCWLIWSWLSTGSSTVTSVLFCSWIIAENPNFITHDDPSDESLPIIGHLTKLEPHVKTLLLLIWSTSSQCQGTSLAARLCTYVQLFCEDLQADPITNFSHERELTDCSAMVLMESPLSFSTFSGVLLVIGCHECSSSLLALTRICHSKTCVWSK